MSDQALSHLRWMNLSINVHFIPLRWMGMWAQYQNPCLLNNLPTCPGLGDCVFAEAF